jgi:hypothetical protein
MSLVVVLFVFGFAPSLDVNGVFTKVDRIDEVVGQVRGRALSAFLRPKMTKEQVEGVLGKSKTEMTISTGGGVYVQCYFKYGLIVLYVPDKDYVFRLSKVEFRPLLR